jgi:hypothetical protein
MTALDTDFVHVGECIGRARGIQRVMLDLICRFTGHLLWRSGSVYRPPEDSLDVNTSHCRRCFKWGYVRGDYRW